MTRCGAIVCRPCPAYKRGLEYYQAKTFMGVGCPILLTIHGMELRIELLLDLMKRR